jgi:ribosomal protein S18 acetylase RimI-like enzyme
MEIIEIDYHNADFQKLCKELDKFQNNLVPERVSLGFTSLAGLENLHDILLVYDGEKAIACGALKRSSKDSAEISRVYTDENYRGQGIGKMIMNELEERAKKKGYSRLVLDTWKTSSSARALYTKLGYKEIPMFDIPTLRNSFSMDDDDKLHQIQDLLVFMEKNIT